MSDKKELNKALLKFQKEVKNPSKNAKNPHFRSNYINLDGLLEAVKPALDAAGLFLSQIFITEDGQTYLMTSLMHSSGESIDSKIPVSPEKASMQGLGSAITYLRRYSIESICGICGSDDDDGNAAVNTGYNSSVNRSSGQRKLVHPSDKQKKYYSTLFKQINGRDMNEEDKKEAASMDIAAISKAIDEMKRQVES